MTPEAQMVELTRGSTGLHVGEQFLERLRAGGPLRVKAGFDPTRPDLHLGHTVLLRKLRTFQDLGHNVVFVVGDFTARIGDPTGRTQTRPVPTEEEIEQGARTYAEQAMLVLDPDRTEFAYNSAWLGRLGFADVLRLAGRYSLARMMERDDFKRRWVAQQSIAMHELLYPLAQAYDSVHLRCDLELGGSDQLFNLLVGRDIMREYGLAPQIVMTMPILEGTDARFEEGVLVGDKMSKSLGNYVGLAEPPEEQFGKLMSICDPLMWRYYELLSDRDAEQVRDWRRASESGQLNPRDCKVALAVELVARFHGEEGAERAKAKWESQFSMRQVPTELQERTVGANGAPIWLPKALALAGLVASSTEGRRRVQQGAVEVDGVRVSDVQTQLEPGRRYVVKAGKRAWAAITVA